MLHLLRVCLRELLQQFLHGTGVFLQKLSECIEVRQVRHGRVTACSGAGGASWESETSPPTVRLLGCLLLSCELQRMSINEPLRNVTDCAHLEKILALRRAWLSLSWLSWRKLSDMCGGSSGLCGCSCSASGGGGGTTSSGSCASVRDFLEMCGDTLSER